MFTVDWEERPKITEVPDSFINGAMKDAPGDYVKVFLYLLMLSHQQGTTCTPDALAGLFGCSENEILAALKYWEKQRLLELYYRGGSLSAVRLTLSASEKTKETHRLNLARVKKVMRDNSDAARLIYVTEQYFGRPLTNTEISTLLYFMDELGFSFDLCDYLVQYCVSRGHTGFRYIEKVGLEWHKNGYQTPEEAKAATTNWTKIHFDVLKAFGIRDRNPIPKEIETIDRWYKEYGFSADMIEEACAIALRATGKQSFEYAEAVLSRWRSEGIHTLAEARKQEDAFRKSRKEQPQGAPGIPGATGASGASGTGAAAKPRTGTATGHSRNQFHNFEQRNDDLDELERRLDRQFAENI